MLIRGSWVLAALLPACQAFAGGSGLNTIVVVNQNSTNSVRLGNDYCEKRGVPPQNFLRITNWSGGGITWSESQFEANLRDPLLALVNSGGLTNQIQYVLLSMDIPYRVVFGESVNATTSDLFYGFKPNDPAPGPGVPNSCSLPDISSNSFAFSERPFDQTKPNTAQTSSFLAFMLTDFTLQGAETILARGVAADSSFPSQTAYLEKTSDQNRSVRFFSFDNAVFDSRIRGDSSIVRITSDSTTFDNVRGLLTGFVTFNFPTNSFVPGALGDNLTSFGGELFENSGQTSLLEFLNAGAVASYGTVDEPCNYLQKFPDPSEFFYQTRGFSAAEAYYMSLLNPYQGLLVGEPLSAPFALVGQVSWTGLVDGTILKGQAVLPPAVFSSAATNLPIQQIDLFIDGVWRRTLTNVQPAAGNLVSLTINGSGVPYAVPAGATLLSVATGLADSINLQSNTLKVAAVAAGDRIEFQGLDPSVPGTNILLSASASAGLAPELTTGVTASRPDFLDTLATGFAILLVSNDTVQGDWLQLQVKETNGTVITLGVTNNTPETNVSLLCKSLLDEVNATPALQSAAGTLGGELYPDFYFAQFVLYARAAGWAASQVQVTLTASSDLIILPKGPDPLQDNLSDLRPRNHLYVSAGLGQLSVSDVLDTTQLADGFHELTLVAYEGTSVRTQTRVSRQVQVQNTGVSAILTAQFTGTNAPIDTPLEFTVNANTNAVASVELFSTGGSLGVVANQSPANFQVAPGFLGIGLHPFYALVTDTLGNRYKTQTIWIRVVPSLQLSIGGQPLAVSWAALPGLVYDILAATNLQSGFQKVASITATDFVATWPIASGNSQSFYRVRLNGGP